MNGKEVRFSSEHISEDSTKNLDREMLFSSFNQMYRVLSDAVKSALSIDRLSEEDEGLLLASLELFLLHCNKLTRSRRVAKEEKQVVKEKRRLIRAAYTNIYHHSHKGPSKKNWVTMPFYKVHDKALAQHWVDQGVSNSIEEVYLKLSEHEEESLRVMTEKWKREREDFTPAKNWAREHPTI